MFDESAGKEEMVASIPVGVELFDVDPGVMMEYERKAVC